MDIMKKLFTLLCIVSYISVSAQYGLLAGTGYAPNFTTTDIKVLSLELSLIKI